MSSTPWFPRSFILTQFAVFPVGQAVSLAWICRPSRGRLRGRSPVIADDRCGRSTAPRGLPLRPSPNAHSLAQPASLLRHKLALRAGRGTADGWFHGVGRCVMFTVPTRNQGVWRVVSPRQGTVSLDQRTAGEVVVAGRRRSSFRHRRRGCAVREGARGRRSPRLPRLPRASGAALAGARRDELDGALLPVLGRSSVGIAPHRRGARGGAARQPCCQAAGANRSWRAAVARWKFIARRRG